MTLTITLFVFYCPTALVARATLNVHRFKMDKKFIIVFQLLLLLWHLRVLITDKGKKGN